jgi:hypothetical protein
LRAFAMVWDELIVRIQGEAWKGLVMTAQEELARVSHILPINLSLWF